jgi:glycosidase
MKEEKIIIYQVFTRLFGNNKTKNQENGTIDENGVGKFKNFSTKALLEIKNLGTTHIWYTGIIEHATQTDYTQFNIEKNHPAIVKGKAGSPYAIKDYYDVCPDLATDVNNRMKEFENLVDRTHKAELKVIIDFVPNHVARQYHSDAKPTGVIDLGEHDEQNQAFNPQNNFYYIPNQLFEGQLDLYANEKKRYHEFPAKATGNDCFNAYPSINDWYETIKLNYGVDYCNGNSKHFHPIPNTWLKMKDILLFWASKQIDGFRCDMAEMVPVEFWEWVIPQVKETYPDILFIAEVYNPNEYRNYIFNGKFDYLYDKVGLHDTLRAITCGHAPASNITHCWQQVDGIQNRMLNFMENHDEQRIASDFFAYDGFAGIPAIIVSATMNSNPFMLYFGQELGERGMDKEGFSGKDGRTTIFDYWNLQSINAWINKGKFDGEKLTEEEKSLQAFYKKLLNLSLTEKSITKGDFYDLMWINYENTAFDATKQYAFLRKKDNELLLVVVNFDVKEVSIKVNIPQHVLEYLGITKKQKRKTIDLLNNESSEEQLSESISIKIAAKKGKILKYQF